MLNIVTLALAVSASTAQANPQPVYAYAQATVVNSTDSTAVFTPNTFMEYMAVKKALAKFWKTTQKSDTALFGKATATVVSHTVSIGGGRVEARLYDYSTLVKKDATLAAIFTNNHITVEEFVSLHLAAVQAVVARAVAEATGAPLPATTTAVGKNVEFLNPHRQELADVGVAVKLSTASDGMGGANNLNP
jgi:hypothetical protein